MIRFILLLTAFTLSVIDSVLFDDDIDTTDFTTRKPTTGRTIRKPKQLQMFIQRLEKKCDFSGLDVIHEDLKSIWANVMAEANEDTSSSEMGDVHTFLKKLIKCYNQCNKRKLPMNFEREWEIYRKIFGKEYVQLEKERRKEIFRKSKENVERHNELYRAGRASYSPEEELQKMNGLREFTESPGAHPRRVARNAFQYYYYSPDMEIPASRDWRLMGYITPVTDQGNCGSCYALAGIGALEAYHKKETGELVRLSVQNILDCTWYLGNNGCDGGSTYSVFKYAKSTGVVSRYWYPYTMNASRNCLWKYEHVAATDEGYYIIPPGAEETLMQAVGKHGPVAVSLGIAGLHAYRSGIFQTEHCGPATHAGLVVGYGTDPEHGDYWIVKNTWGYWWGEDGYVRMARNKRNLCHIASKPYFPF